MCYRIRSCWDNHLSQHFYVIGLSDNPKLQNYYRLMDYFTLIAFNVLPIVILCTINSRLIMTIWKVVDRDIKTRSSLTSDDIDIDNVDDTRSCTITPTNITTTTSIRSNNAVIENAAFVTDATKYQKSVAQRFNANAMLFAVVIMLLICVGLQAPARLLFNHYGKYDLTTIIYMCVTQHYLSHFYKKPVNEQEREQNLMFKKFDYFYYFILYFKQNMLI
ncbi:hypothetical protein LOAG_02548 [Loa loa]|uniref:Uncharacterized protein n=1 Tax=Loa loa TaxID=7209 RepID=A0A1S0U6F8_LOALO|nr:hypothetical protein LOAG_02548 [Loa loa]EFO25939.2 hypothetical protein LOAG_02548 [Loa loa]